MEEAKSLKYLASQFPFLSFRWVPREANEASHSLAKWSLMYSVSLDSNVFVFVFVLVVAFFYVGPVYRLRDP